MQPIFYSTKLMNMNGNVIFNFPYQNFFSSWFEYLISWNKRTAVDLQNWLDDQVTNANLNPDLVALCNKITTADDADQQAWEVMNWVQDFIKYESDVLHRKDVDYWQTASETITDMTGDCEDGVVLTYVLCRMKGVPANRLLIWLGDVQYSSFAPTECHCCLFYKPYNYPLNFVNLDWCYFPNKKNIEDRNMFTFAGKNIEEWNYVNLWVTTTSYYKTTEFVFNEEYTSIDYRRK